MRIKALLALSLVGAMFGCAEEFTIDLVQPADGDTVSLSEPTTFLVSASSNFTFDGAAQGKDPEAGKGHWHLYIDDTKIAVTAETSVTVDLSTVEINGEPLSLGAHTVFAQLVENNHEPLDPDVRDTIEINLVE